MKAIIPFIVSTAVLTSFQVATSQDCLIVEGEWCCDTIDPPDTPCLCGPNLYICPAIIDSDIIYNELKASGIGWSFIATACDETYDWCCTFRVAECGSITNPCGCSYPELKHAENEECCHHPFPQGPPDCPGES